MKTNATIEAFVLAGGKSSRMGQEKGLVLLKNKPLVTYVLNTLQKWNIPIKIVANDPGYIKFGVPVVTDVVSKKGPMGGLLTAFNHSTAERILLISCDMPFLSAEAIGLLMEYADQEEIIAMETEGRINPLFSLYPTSLKQKLENSIAEGKLKMTSFILNNSHTLVSSNSLNIPWCFQNINDKNELKNTEEKWGHLL